MAAAAAAQSQERDGKKTAGLMQDLAVARQELMANELQYRRALAEERDRSAALANELATARREVETQVALSSKTGDEAAQLKRAAETATAELQQSLQQQRDKTLALENELAMARRDVETEVLTPRKTDDQLKQATKNAQAELRQSPQQERDKPGEPARGPKSTAGPVSARLPLAANSQTTKVGQAVTVAGGKQPAAAEADGNLETARLVERANALLGQGNIGAARVVLERAAETGSAQASFRLAETYDPLVLSTWRIYGTQGDTTKARELYAKAFDGGIKAAKDRSDALQTAGSEAK
jgi:hypothetical protein